MTDTNIDVRGEWGCVLAVADDKAGMQHRWWFDETDAGRLVFISEVVHYDDGEHPPRAAGRHYVPETEAEVPERVRTALEAEGYDMLLDTDGKLL